MNQTSIKKYVAEMIGTFTLVFIGCGSAMSGVGTLAIAFAFGLTIVAMAYSIGRISGCHVNPAVSLGVYLNGGMTTSDFIGYVVSQCAGSFVGTLMLRIIFGMADRKDMTASGDDDEWGMGANALTALDDSIFAGLLVEIILTCIFVFVILSVTSKKSEDGKLAGIVIGLTLTLVHIVGIPLTGTSVNPARSLFPAIFAMGDPIKKHWVFILGPAIGAVAATFLHRFIEPEK